MTPAATSPRGFVLAAGMALILMCAVGVTVLLAAAALFSDKQRGSDLSDAAALSVATWYAQAMNYQAYANRAIIANEVMIAQSLTLLSWIKHLETITRNTGQVAALFPALSGVSAWLEQATVATRGLAQAAVVSEVPFRSAYTRALQASQEAMQLAANPFATQSLVNEVIWSGDPRFFGQYLPTSDVSTFYRSVRSFGGADRQLQAQHILEQLDTFSRSRGFDQRLYLLPSTGCVPTSVNTLFSRLVRRGGTALTQDFREWESVDTLSVHRWQRGRGWFRVTCRGISESFPLGWGSAQAATPVDAGLMAQAGTAANGQALSRARSEGSAITGYLGLSGYRDLSDQSAVGRRQATFRIPILVRLTDGKRLAPAATEAVNRLARLGGEFNPAQADGFLGKAVWAVSVGQVSFVDPTSGPIEHLPSLFMPFWNANLTALSVEDQAAAMLVAGRRTGP